MIRQRSRVSLFSCTRRARGSNIHWVINTIIIEPAGPTSLSISINDGAARTTSLDVTLTLSASDGSGSGLRDMCFSNDGTTYSEWETFATSKSWTLLAGDGTKYVYFKVRDNAMNVAGPVYDTIVKDTIVIIL